MRLPTLVEEGRQKSGQGAALAPRAAKASLRLWPPHDARKKPTAGPPYAIKKHVTDVTRALIGKQSITVKDLIKHFEPKSREQKANTKAILQEVAAVSKGTDGLLLVRLSDTYL